MSATTSLDTLRALYDPELFRATAAPVVGALTDYLERVQTPPLLGKPPRRPEDLVAIADSFLAQAPTSVPELGTASARTQFVSKVAALSEEYLASVNRIHSPHYIGHQVCPPLPLAGIFEAIGSVSNQPTGVFEMGPFSAAAERALVRRIGAHIGWAGNDWDGVGTHGGSLANLTALLAARNARVEGSWKAGIGQRRPAILTSADSHYCIARSAGILGLGTDQVIKVELDERRRMRPEALQRSIVGARARGLDPFAVIGSACTTSTGSFDPLRDVGAIAKQEGLWFHVDGAHGASFLLSRRYRGLLDGVDQADSLIWDAHKMMYVPALCTFVFYKDRRQSYGAFDQDAPYLFNRATDGETDSREFDVALRVVECTRRPLSMALWAVWSALGASVFETLVDRVIDQTREFYELLQEAEDFRPLHDPECNILCFRYEPRAARELSAEKLSDLQAAIRARLIDDGRFYITATRLDGAAVLRVTIIHPLTERAHLESLMTEIRRIGTELLDRFSASASRGRT